MTFASRTFAVLLTCSALLVLDAPEALAHDRLKHSSPARDATVKALKTIELEFTSRVRLPKIVMRDGDGKAVEVGNPRAAGDTVTARVPGSLAAGRYVIGWRALSADGDPIEGEIPFRVKSRPEPTPGPTLTAAAEPAPPLTASTTPPPISQPVSQSGGQGMPAWPWMAGGLLLIAGAGYWLVDRRRKRPGHSDRS
jgi:methionine-rich copper-binding protein CopC